ncbi:MAG: hypothetical protein ACLQGP_37295 [Isosphaeraceae bacterium]
MTQIDDDPTTFGTQTARSTAFPMAVLIAVPKVQSPRVRRVGMTSSVEAWRPKLIRRPPRRRLRRGVRRAAWSLLAVLSILGASALDWANLASRAASMPAWDRDVSASSRGPSHDDETGTGEPSSASIDVHAVYLDSSGPVMGAPVADVELPVIIPGYLLPDDSLEEPVHEGS